LIILDELYHAKQLLKDGLQTSYPKLKDIIIIAKYLAYIGEGKKDIYNKLYEICLETDKNFNLAINGWKIKKAINSTNLYRLRTPFPVTITKDEIEAIQYFPDYNYQKVLFVLLVYAKFLKYADTKISPSKRPRVIGEFFVNERFNNIVKVARVTITKQKRNDMLHKFYLEGYIDGTVYNSIVVKYVKEKGDIEIIVTDLENIVLHYQRYCGERVAGCECGQLFLKRSNRHKMCRNCWKERRKTIQKEYEKRKNTDV